MNAVLALIDTDGRQRRDSVTGKLAYAPVLSWSDRGRADKFSEVVIAAAEIGRMPSMTRPQHERHA